MQGNVIKEFSSIDDAAKELGILACNISNCLHGKQKSTPRNLYTWKFLDIKPKITIVRNSF